MHSLTVTYSKNIFIPVTNLCRNDCAYCGFKRHPESGGAYLMPQFEVETILKERNDAKEALFTFGERIEEVAYGEHLLNELGYTNMVDYLIDLCKIAIKAGLLPHSNMGLVDYDDLVRLKPFNASMGVMLETTANIEAHRRSPGKDPALRIEMIENAGKLKIPFTTGILSGIGERREDRIISLEEIARIHDEYGHIQEVIIQPFHPKPGTRMSTCTQPTFDEMRDAVVEARRILPEDVTIQVPPNLTSFERLIDCGANDLGGISSLTPDYINPEAPWPIVKELEKMIAPHRLKERLAIYPKYIKMGWMGERVKDLTLRYADEL
ncbi:MAG: FO synthase subunit 1 [Candidatus Syntrophoarchaeum sp. GoM_oil]|nr:MAG: FO synthase subunit 1 [Candidatus Syntrophoarchaeum sp. GoM_oil]